MDLTASWSAPGIIAGGAGGCCRSTSALAANHNSCTTKPRRYGITSLRTFRRTASPKGISVRRDDYDQCSNASRIFGISADPGGGRMEAKVGTAPNGLRVPVCRDGDGGRYRSLDHLFGPGARGAILAARGN